MPFSRHFRTISYPLFVSALLIAPACGDDVIGDDAGNDETGTTGGAASTGDAGSESGLDESSTGGGASTTASPTTGSDESGSDGGTTDGSTNARELGDTPTPECDAALAELAIIVEQNASETPDVAAVQMAYEGSVLQDFVRDYGLYLGRVEGSVLLDDQAILTALAGVPTPEELIDVETRIVTVMALTVRDLLKEVVDAQPDPTRDPALLYAILDEAYCIWDGALRVHAVEADEVGIEIAPIEADIQAGFELGHAGIESDEAAHAIDQWAVPAAKQIVEKNMYRAYDRLVTKYAQVAAEGDDSLAAHRALGYFQVLLSRMEGRNTPGIEIVESALLGNPTQIDVADIRRQLNITWIKRTRAYTDKAIEENTVGEPSGFTGANEGRTYAKVIIPFMAEAIEGFDAEAHLQVWTDYVTAIQENDVAAATAASETLTAANCEYQTFIGIAECTGSADETAP